MNSIGRQKGFTNKLLGIRLALLITLVSLFLFSYPGIADNHSNKQLERLLSDAAQLAGNPNNDTTTELAIQKYRGALLLDNKNEDARQALAKIAWRTARDIEQAEALEDQKKIAILINRLIERLHDVLWRSRYAANHGNTNAQLAMGLFSRQGILMDADPGKGCVFYELAADKKNPYAEYRFGLCLSKIKPDNSLDYLSRAANSGHAAAQHLLGEHYLGKPEEQPDKAFNWIKRAADKGRPSAKSLLGWLYASGIGADQDLKKAFHLYREAAEKGNLSAQNNLGELYETGRGTPKDLKMAVNWYKGAAQQGFAPAQLNLGRLYATGTGFAQDHCQAISWLKKAQQQGITQASDIIQWMIRNNYQCVSPAG